VDANEPAVVMLTGSGLKDVQAAMQAAGEALVIAPKLEELREVLKK
jgi:threonine synthase